jgi:outer membrane lipoprotein-sorting protein
MKKNLKRLLSFIALVTLACVVISSPLIAETPEEKGLRIVTSLDTRPTLEKSIAETVLHIYDAQGKKLFSKKSRSASYMKDFRDPDKRLSRSLSYFFSPADDKGNGALMIEIDGDDDDQWLYLKGLRKPKRVLGSDKSSSFMGSDFSNGDVAARDIEDYNYKWLGTEKIKFKKKNRTVEKIEARFKSKQLQEDYGYSKTIAWIHVGSGLALKNEMYNLNGQLSKTMRLVDFKVKKNRDGKKIFMPTYVEMKNVLKGTRTVMQMKNIKTGKKAAKIKPGIFKVDYLTRRWW